MYIHRVTQGQAFFNKGGNMQYKIKDVCHLLNSTVYSVKYYCDLRLVSSFKYDKMETVFLIMRH